MTRFRGSRSAQTPAKSVSTTRGTVFAANTIPRSLAEPVRCSTAKARATAISESPTAESACPVQRSRNGRSLRAATFSRIDPTSSRVTPYPT